MIGGHGRKFAAMIVGVACVMALTIIGFIAAIVKADLATLASGILPVAIGSVAGMVATFITGNSAVTFAYAKSDMTRTEESRQIADRRDVASGIEPTP